MANGQSSPQTKTQTNPLAKSSQLRTSGRTNIERHKPTTNATKDEKGMPPAMLSHFVAT
jgi:hypothetical protein